jgi:predicted PurR-regulated permease PerM
MNYKFSNREKLLLQAMTIILVVVALFTITSTITNNINKSRIELFQELDNFNQSKQQLAQIKELKLNISSSLNLNQFKEILVNEGLVFSNKDSSFLISGLSSEDALALLRVLDQNNADIASFDLKLQNDGLLSLNIEIND